MTLLQPTLVVDPKRGELLAGVRLPGEPVPASRHRARIAKARDGRQFVQPFHAPEYRAWRRSAEARLRAWWGRRAPLRDAVVCSAVFVFPRPAKGPRAYTVGGIECRYPFAWSDGRNPHLGTSDLDNLRKALLDALVAAEVLADDRLVVRDRGEKWYAGIGEEPCMEVKLWRA